MDGLVSIGSLFSGGRLEKKDDELKVKLKRIIREIKREKEE